MMSKDQQIAITGITCPVCWTPIAFEAMEKTIANALGVLTFGFECETCNNAYIASYEQIGDKVAWKSRIFV